MENLDYLNIMIVLYFPVIGCCYSCYYYIHLPNNIIVIQEEEVENPIIMV